MSMVTRQIKLAMVALGVMVLLATALVSARGDGAAGPALPFDVDQAMASPAYLLAQVAREGTSIFLEIGDIKGESADRDHKDWIDVTSYGLGFDSGAQATNGSTRRRSRATHTPLSVTKEIDKATPKLMESLVTGRRHPRAVMELTTPAGDSGRVVYLKVELTNVLVTSYNVSGSAGGNDEELDFDYGAIKVTYSQYNGAGQKVGDTVFTYDFETAS